MLRLAGPVRARQIYVVAAALGLLVYFCVYGPGHAIGSSSYWQVPQQDEQMALMGYRYFLHAPWHWPLFASDAVNVPYVKSLAFLDCIPIWALVNKALATVVPPWASFSEHAYLGLWHALAHVLQACFGVACLRALGHTSWRAGLVTAVVFVSIPTWIFRYAHPALSAHWILLWGLLLYFRTPVGMATPRRLALAKLGPLVVSSLVTPYHAAFSFSLYLPSVLRSRHRRTIAVWLPLGFAVTLFALWLAGYFAGESMRAQWGFEVESANLVGWLIPQRSGIVGDLTWIATAQATPWQYEGYAYLGLGVLLLLALFALHARSLGKVIARHPVLFAVVVASCGFALSNHIYAGSHELLAYRMPWFLRRLKEQFRSPGRFVWVPTYVLTVFLLHWAFTTFATGRRFAVVVLAAALQLLDARGDWALQRVTTDGPQHPVLDQEAWRALVHAHRAVSILPPYGCVTGSDAPELDHASREIQFLASEEALPINGTYSARDLRHCAAEEAGWSTLALEPGMLYVVLPPARAAATRLEQQGATCGAFPAGWACSANAAAVERGMSAGALR